MLTKLKLLLSITDNEQDKLLLLLIERAIDFAKAYTHQENISVMESVILQMASYSYSRRGTEGLANENYSGVSFEYTTDYPADITKALNAYRKVKFI